MELKPHMTLPMALIALVLVNFTIQDPYPPILRLLTAVIPFASAYSAIRSQLNARVIFTAIALFGATAVILGDALGIAAINQPVLKAVVNYLLVGAMAYSAYKLFYKENKG